MQHQQKGKAGCWLCESLHAATPLESFIRPLTLTSASRANCGQGYRESSCIGHCRRRALWLTPITSGSRTSETGAEIFERPEIISAFPPKMTFSCFNVLFFRRTKSVADIDAGGQTILTFRQIHNAIITLSAPEGPGGQTAFPCSIVGPWPDLPLWIRH